MSFPKKAKLYNGQLIFFCPVGTHEETFCENFPTDSNCKLYSLTCQEEDNLLIANVWIWSEAFFKIDCDEFQQMGLAQALKNLETFGEKIDHPDFHFKYACNVEEAEGDLFVFDQYDMTFINQNPQICDLLIEYKKKYTQRPPDRGAGRMTFYDQEQAVVYKLPLRQRGVKDNFDEARFSEQKEQHIANCQIINPGEQIPILKMELLDTDLRGVRLPRWALDIEFQQVGLDKTGTLKAFDLY